MKKLAFLSALLFLAPTIYAQNIGIQNPNPSQKLSVNGKIEIGTDGQNPTAGSIKYENGIFSGYNGSQWMSFTNAAMDAIQVNEAINPDTTLMSFSTNTSDTSGVIYDSGGPTVNYSNNENLTHKISGLPQYLYTRIIIAEMNIETDLDVLTITNEELTFNYSGNFTSNDTLLFDGSKTITIRFNSNTSNTFSGYRLEWSRISGLPQGVDALTGFYFNSEKLAIGGGASIDNSWDSDSIGLKSINFGIASTPLGDNSITIGNYARTLSDHSISIGSESRAEAEFSPLAIGYQAIATGNSGIAIGSNALVRGGASLALGDSAQAFENESVSIGSAAFSGGTRSVAIGRGSLTSSNESVAIGALSQANIIGSIALGYSSRAATTDAIAIGKAAWNSGSGGISIGRNTFSEAANSILIGKDAMTGANADGAIALGFQAEVLEPRAIAIGVDASSKKANGVSMGWNANAAEESSVALGSAAHSQGQESIALGDNATSNMDGGISIGTASNSKETDGISVGRNSAANEKAVALGRSSNAFATQSVSIGDDSGATGVRSVAIGSEAKSLANRSVVIGDGATTSDSLSVVIGGEAYESSGLDYFGATSSGPRSVAIGNHSISDENGVALGQAAKADYNSVVIGQAASNSTSTNNEFGSVVIGNRAIIIGESNTAIGRKTDVRGNYSIAIGSGKTGNVNASSNTGAATTIADSSIAIGFNSFVEGDNSIALGNGVYVLTNNTIRIGNANVSSIGGAVDWSVVSDARFKTNIRQEVPGLDFIRKLRPVTYNLDMEQMVKFKGGNAKPGGLSNLKTGFIAQDVEQAAKEISYEFNAIHKPLNDKDHYTLSYAQFVVPLTQAVKELDAKNQKLEADLAELQGKYEQILELLSAKAQK